MNHRATVTLLLGASLLSFGATTAEARKRSEPVADLATVADPLLVAQGRDALARGDGVAAVPLLAEAVARQPRNGSNQSLLALAWHLRGGTDPQAMDMALAGYDLARRMEPGQYWPSAMLGRIAFDQGKYELATEHFARAALLRPSDARAIAALAAAAYMAGDAGLASLAADRAATLDPANIGALRIAAYSAAAMGDAERANAGLAALTAADPDSAANDRSRVAQLLQTDALDQPTGFDEGSAGFDPVAPDQISLDVAIVLAQNTRREHTGINLLDGLSLQYGFNRQATRTIQRDSFGGSSNGYQRVLTASISVPQLNYNLNLFNRGGQYYSVVARPQLTAYRGEESQFFVGRTMKVAVGGVNFSSLEQIDVGIDMKVTPIEITPDGTRVRIEVGRSFVTADPAGSFAEALTTFRQNVAATAEIRFGETLVLSGLTETVDDKTFSKTPVLGDIPLVGNLFSETNLTQRRDAVLVLVTPSRPTALPGRPFLRSEQASQIGRLWTDVIDPMSNAEETRRRLDHVPIFSRMTRRDVAMAMPDAREAAPEILAELAIR
ncbi:MAG: secretion protein [Sphingomonadaceae bacterium]|nr:secretion protein [Sphingomonadaceae bacterium]